MRSSKSRSRNKNNRNNNNNRSGVNIVNRVFDSSGPEGKVRGTPQQIIDKYNQLARDAQLSNDRVAAENFQQHAEHYLRILSEAQREIDARREQEAAQQAQRDRQHQQNQQNNQNNQQNNQNAPRPSEQEQPVVAAQPAAQPEAQPQAEQEQPSGDAVAKDAPAKDEKPAPRPRRTRTPRATTKRDATAQDDVIDTGANADSGLVETPESKPAKPRRTRAKPKPKAEEGSDAASGNPEAAE